MGRKPLTSDTPLKPAEVRYVEAITRGCKRIEAWRAAGFPVEPNSARQRDKIWRLEQKPNIKAALDTARIEAQAARASVMADPPPLPEDGNITDEWLAKQGHFMFVDAYAREDTDGAFKALNFLLKLKQVRNSRGPGRPPSAADPNKGDVNGNYAHPNSDSQVPAEGADEDSWLADIDDGDGELDSSWDQPFHRTSATGSKSKPGVGLYRPGSTAKRSAGAAGEDRVSVSGEVEGE